MKKFFLVALILCVASYIAGADDIITKVNGEQIKAKVTEIGDDTVKFKRMDNPNGPVYSLFFSEIHTIQYESGLVEKFSDPAPEEPRHYADSYDVRYRDIVSKYNPRAYQEGSDDPYVPAVAGVASFFIPGLGQCIDGEWGRGLGIFAANLGFGILETAEASMMFYAATQDASYYKRYSASSMSSGTLMGASMCAAILTASAHLVFNIWNICDAVNIAKVKNMYYQDINMAPKLALSPSFGNGLQPAAGLSLTLSF